MARLISQGGLVSAYVGDGLLFLGAVASFIIAIYFSRRAIKEHVELSKRMHGNNGFNQT
jgi:hypothetical protein